MTTTTMTARELANAPDVWEAVARGEAVVKAVGGTSGYIYVLLKYCGSDPKYGLSFGHQHNNRVYMPPEHEATVTRLTTPDAELAALRERNAALVAAAQAALRYFWKNGHGDWTIAQNLQKALGLPGDEAEEDGHERD